MSPSTTSKSNHPPLYEQVATKIADMVQTGTFRPGERVPSIRGLSKQMQVSINTVKEAYGFLEDRHIIEARPQSGYYVRPALLAVPHEPQIEPPQCLSAAPGPTELVMSVLKDCMEPGLVQFGAGIPCSDQLPKKRLSRMMAAQIRKYPAESVGYLMPPGYGRLRAQIAKHMLQAQCVFRADDILMASGGTEAVFLALRATCQPGDTVAVETPLYFSFLQMIQNLGLKVVEIPASPKTGISLEALKYALENTPINACLVISNFNNPLGSLIPDENKKALVTLLESYRVPLIEDDVHGDLAFDGSRPSVAKAYDKTGNVILCSSFSKTLAPGYRVGWLAPGKYLQAVERQKVFTSLASPGPPQLAVAEYLANGGYDRHLRTIRRVYSQKVAAMSDSIGRNFPKDTCVSRPKGSFTLWVQMHEAVDSRLLYIKAKSLGISIAPGTIFSVTDKYRNFMRLNAAFYSERVEWAVEALGRIAGELAGEAS